MKPFGSSAFSSLHVRLLSIVLVAVVPVLAITLHTHWLGRGDIIEEEKRDALAIATSVAGNIARGIDGIQELLTAIAHMPNIRHFQFGGCDNLLAPLTPHLPVYRNIAMATPDGKVVCSSAPLSRPTNVFVQRWFQLALSTREFTIGSPGVDPIVGLPGFYFAYPIIDSRAGVRAVIFISVDSAWAQSILEQVEILKPTTITLTDASGVIVARRPDPEKWVGMRHSEKAVYKFIGPNRENAMSEGIDIDGVAMVFGVAPLFADRETNLHIRVGIARKAVLADANRALLVKLVLLAAVTLLALLAARASADGLVLHPVRALVSATNHLAAGDLRARSGISPAKGELYELATGFDQMAAKLEKHEARLQAALRGTEERHRMLLESTAEGIFGLDLEGRCTFINRAAATMLGYRPEEFLGKDIESLLHRTSVDESPAPAENSFIYRAKQAASKSCHEEVFWRSDKSFFPAELSSHPIFTADNQISGAVVTFSDITERKRAEASQRKRVQEIQALHEIGQTILNSRDLQTIVEGILDKTQSLGGFDLGLIRLLDRSSKQRKPVASRGYRNPERIRSVASDPDDPNFASAQANVLTGGQAEIIEDVSAVQGMRTIKQEGVKSAMIVPIKAETVILGTMLLGSRTPKKFRVDEIHVLEAIGHQLGIAVQKSWLEEETQRNLERIRALHEIGKAITSTLNLGAILQILFEKIGLFLPYQAASLRLKNPETGLLELIAAPNIDAKQWEAFSKTAGGGLTRVVFESQAPLIVKNIQHDPRTLNAAFAREQNLVSLLGLPLIAKGECLGVLGLFTREEYESSSEELDFALALAGQAAIAIHNSQMYQRVQKREFDIEQALQRLEALYSVTAASSESLNLDGVLNEVIRRITEIFNFNVARIFLFDSARENLVLKASFETVPELFEGMVTFLRGQGLVGKVAESGESLIFEDVLNDPRYLELSHSKRSKEVKQRFLAALPIKGKYRILGSMLLSHAEPRSLTSSELDLLTAITRQVAVAVENMTLFEETVHRAEELWAKTIELEQANKVKDEFLGVMSHELRTPLNVMTGYLGLTRNGMFGALNAEQSEALDKISRQSDVLMNMVRDILHVTQLDSGAARVKLERVSLPSFLEELKTSYQLPLDKELAVLWDYPDDLPPLETNSEKLTRVLQNLIDNAIKFTDKGTITVSARAVERSEPLAVSGEQTAVSSEKSAVNSKGKEGRLQKSEFRFEKLETLDPRPETLDHSGNCVEFKVSDTGMGIPTESLPFIFEKFHQADSSNTRDFGGVGLGLYIAKKETELLGGKIELASELGKGTIFTVTIPCHAPPAMPNQSTLPKNGAAHKV